MPIMTCKLAMAMSSRPCHVGELQHAEFVAQLAFGAQCMTTTRSQR